MTSHADTDLTRADRTSVDLNADLAEGYGRWSFGTDDDLLAVVSSANVACGFHAGDPSVIRSALAVAATRRVTVGAHVGYPDLQGFGRRFMDLAHQELVDAVVYQVSALSGLARIAGTSVRYVKPHGALYNRVAVDSMQAKALAEAIATVDPTLAVLSLPGSALQQAAASRDLTTIDEVFADRAYLANGQLAPRSMPGAVVHDVDVVVERVLRMVLDGQVVAVDGSVVDVHADSICVHGDSPDAVNLAQRVAESLCREGVEVRSPLLETPV